MHDSQTPPRYLSQSGYKFRVRHDPEYMHFSPLTYLQQGPTNKISLVRSQRASASIKPATSSSSSSSSSSLPPVRRPQQLSTSIMTPRSLLLCVLVALSVLCTVWCTPVCNNNCCRFVEEFPSRLQKLRQDYSRIRDYYVSKSSAVTLHVP